MTVPTGAPRAGLTAAGPVAMLPTGHTEEG